MPLEMRKTSKWWHGRFNVRGRPKVLNLDVEIKGKRPSSISEEDDRAFERSRGRTQAKFNELVKEAATKKRAEETVQTLHEIRTGHRVSSIPLSKMARAWKDIPRKRPMSPTYISTREAVFRSFVDFPTRKHPDVKDMAAVTPQMAREWLRAQERRGISPRTWNANMGLLRSAFHRLRKEAGVVENPFEDFPKKEEQTVHRRPFTPEQLQAIVKAPEAQFWPRQAAPFISAGHPQYPGLPLPQLPDFLR